MAIAIIVVVAFCIVFFKGCGSAPQNSVAKRDTVIILSKSDTVIRQIVGTSPQLQPLVIQTTPAQQSSIPIQYQQLSSNVQELSSQMKEVVAQLYAINHFDNTIHLTDDSGKEVGQVFLPQDVSQNKLLPFTPKYKLQFPIVTNTIVKLTKEPYQERNKLFIGGGIMGDQYSPISGVRAGFVAQNKRGVALEVNATRSWHYWGGEIGIYKLLSFRKKK